MRYFGGKTKIREQLKKMLLPFLVGKSLYVEPFVGGCGIFSVMPSPKIGADIHKDLILMWKAIQKNWIPPNNITIDDYNKLKFESPSALRGFVGFGCSHSAKFFAGYAKGTTNNKLYKRNYALEAKESLLRKRNGITISTAFVCADYRKFSFITNALIYCDPPYQLGHNPYNSFNSLKFWQIMREWSSPEKNNNVIISEFSAPIDFSCIGELGTRNNITQKNTRRYIERLFKYK